ncbi:MAG: hypothetical protein ACSLE6_02940 [Mycobacterium sp.]
MGEVAGNGWNLSRLTDGNLTRDWFADTACTTTESTPVGLLDPNVAARQPDRRRTSLSKVALYWVIDSLLRVTGAYSTAYASNFNGVEIPNTIAAAAMPSVG